MNNNITEVNDVTLETDLASAAQIEPLVSDIPSSGDQEQITDLAAQIPDEWVEPDWDLMGGDPDDTQGMDVLPEMQANADQDLIEMRAQTADDVLGYCDSEGIEGDQNAWKKFKSLLLDSEASAASGNHLSASHLEYLVANGFDVGFLQEINAQSLDVSRFSVTSGDLHLEFSENQSGKYVCTSEWSYIEYLDSSLEQGKAAFVYVTNDPLMLLLGMQVGVQVVATTQYGWLSEETALPLPSDEIYAIKAGEPCKRLLKAVFKKQVILCVEVAESSMLGHSLKFHQECNVNICVGKNIGVLDMAHTKLDAVLKRTSELPHFFKPTRYGKFGKTPLNYYYPAYYEASDEDPRSIEMDCLEWVKNEKGEKEPKISRKTLEGMPTCRIEYTKIGVPSEGHFVLFGKCSKESSVTEVVSGVTTSGRMVTMDHEHSDYSVSGFLGMEFTETEEKGVLVLRKYFSAQKKRKNHPLVYTTALKGWFGVEKLNGERIYPAGYIAEGKVIQRPDVDKVDTRGGYAVHLATSGNSKEWKKIIALLLKNSSFAAVFGFAISGILMPFTKESGSEPGFLNLYGDSGAGKTTLLKIIASAITAPHGTGEEASYLMSFRSTENGFEAPMAARNNSVVMYDEVGSADVQIDWPSVIYMIANGVGKTRMSKDTGGRPTKRWTTQIIGTGEASIESKISAKGAAMRTGLFFRLIEIGVESVPYFEHMKEQINGDSLGDYQELCNQYYPSAQNEEDVLIAVLKGLYKHHGHSWWEMAHLLMQEQKRNELVESFSTWQRFFTSKLNGRQEKVVHRRSKHLANALTGLQLLLEIMREELSDSERASIVAGAADWVEKYMWRAGLPEGKFIEREITLERVLEKIASNPDRFFKFGEEHPSKNFNGFWGMVKNDRVFLFASGLDSICKDLNEDPKRIRTALIGLEGDNAWLAKQERPGGGSDKQGIRGLLAPANFALLG